MSELLHIVDLLENNLMLSLIVTINLATHISIILFIKKPNRRKKTLTNIIISIIFGIIWYYVAGYEDIKNIIVASFASTGTYHIIIKRLNNLNTTK